MPGASEFTSIGIIFAMEIESRGLRRVLAHSRRVQSKQPSHTSWQLGKVRVTAVLSGIGGENAATATQSLIAAGARAIINAGFAAALDSKAQVGDVVIVNRVLNTGEGKPTLVCDDVLTAAIPPSGSLGYSVWQSDVITADRMILDPEEKRLIYATTGAAALDMECYAAAESCDARKVPFLSIKAVSDTASEDLPRELTELAEIHGTLRLLLFLLRHPRLWLRLWRLRKHALKASENLGDAMGIMLLRLSRT